MMSSMQEKSSTGVEEEYHQVGGDFKEDAVGIEDELYTMALDDNTQKTVVFSVGGERFETLVSTLQQYPSTMLGSMFSSSERLIKYNSKGEIFLDRDPAAFRIVLNFFRTGKIYVPPGMPQSLVREELQYFGIIEDDANIICLPPDDQVVLNVGGTRFETKVHTLAKHPDTLLGSMFAKSGGLDGNGKPEDKEEHPSLSSTSFFDTVTKFLTPSSSTSSAPASPVSSFRVDLNGEIFIDRSAATFEAIMEWYRTGELHYNPFVSTRESFLKELEYFKIPYHKISNHEAWHKILTSSAAKRIDELQEKVQRIFVKFVEKGLSKVTIIVCPGRFASRPAVIKEDPWEAIVEQNLSFYHQNSPFNVSRRIQEKMQHELGLKIYCNPKLINVRIGNNPALRAWHILLVEVAV